MGETWLCLNKKEFKNESFVKTRSKLTIYSNDHSSEESLEYIVYIVLERDG